MHASASFSGGDKESYSINRSPKLTRFTVCMQYILTPLPHTHTHIHAYTHYSIYLGAVRPAAACA